MVNCKNCGLHMTKDNVDDFHPFHIERKTCALDHTISLGNMVVWICDDCVKAGHIPKKEYTGSIVWKEPWELDHEERMK